MFQRACGVLCQDQGVKLNIRGVFDGLAILEQVEELAAGSPPFDRLIFNFSGASRVRVIELYYLLSELATDPRFAGLAFSIEDLPGKCMA